MTNDKRTADQEPASDDAVKPTEDDTEGHSLLSAQLGGVIAGERAREAANWARAEQARRRQQEHKKGSQR